MEITARELNVGDQFIPHGECTIYTVENINSKAGGFVQFVVSYVNSVQGHPNKCHMQYRTDHLLHRI